MKVYSVYLLATIRRVRNTKSPKMMPITAQCTISYCHSFIRRFLAKNQMKLFQNPSYSHSGTMWLLFIHETKIFSRTFTPLLSCCRDAEGVFILVINRFKNILKGNILEGNSGLKINSFLNHQTA